MNRGDFHRYRGALEPAIEDYSRAIELEPRDPYFRRSRGHALHSLGRFAEAIADYDVAIDVERASRGEAQ